MNTLFGGAPAFQVRPGDGGTCTLGELRLTAAPVGNGIPAAGQLVQIMDAQALFALLGVTYGGDGVTTFGVPDMRPFAPTVTVNGTAAALTYTICDRGVFPLGR